MPPSRAVMHKSAFLEGLSVKTAVKNWDLLKIFIEIFRGVPLVFEK
jgi:hypothetical protein